MLVLFVLGLISTVLYVLLTSKVSQQEIKEMLDSEDWFY